MKKRQHTSFPIASLGLVLFVLLPLFWLVSIPPTAVGQRLNDTQAGSTSQQFDLPTADDASLIYGLNFINSIEHPADSTQFQNGLATGATWNRWPLYWNRLEPSPGQFDWSQHDQIVQADLDHGLNINAILLGTPGFYTTSPNADAQTDEPLPPPDTLAVRAIQAAAPQGLYDPIFTDGTDTPGAGKQINPGNRWARFVYEIVNRYKPGGVLAQARNWPTGQGITHWEMWNEPDYSIFWDSSLADYARLLKVGYLAGKQADHTAVVLFGGLANNGNPNFYADVLSIYDSDPLAAQHNYFHDIFVTHNYSYAWQSWYHVYRAEAQLKNRDLDKPIWLNESGVPAWDDYPGPVWDSKSGLRATKQEQANFVLQSALYARFAGADGIFHFQLYDGCGNQPAYTNFPPHNGELCDSNGKLKSDPSKPCAGDANGLFSNPSDAICFAQHPTPESPRPSFTAYKLLTTHLQNIQPLWRSRPGGEDPYNGPQELIAFYQPSAGKRVIGMWARDNRPQTAVITATAGSALLIHADGTQQTITPQDGVYRINLPGATNQNAFWDPNLYMIGGDTRLLIEDFDPSQVDNTPPTVSAWGRVCNEAKTEIELTWQGSDTGGSGIRHYNVAVQVEGGAEQAWLTETTETTAVYASEPGRLYTFWVTAVDNAGNRSTPRRVLVLTLDLPVRGYFPIVIQN